MRVEVPNQSALDDDLMLMPSGDSSLQVPYGNMAIPGTGLVPFIAMASLVTP